MDRPLTADLVASRSVAVVGASERNAIARITLTNLRRAGFPGDVVGVHPSGRPLDGFTVVPSLDDAPEQVDLALLAVGAGNLPGAMRAAADAGVRNLVIPGAGANERGREVEPELRTIARERGLSVLGPNCMGFAALHQRLVPYVGELDPDLQRGRIGLASQSGSVCEMFTTLPWRVGLSHVLSVGNELTVDLTDALAFMVDDETTGAIGLFVEGVRRPDAFREALRRAAEAEKPVVALKVGRSDFSRAGTVAHTGALAGDARVFSAVLRDAGAIEVDDLDQMLVALEILGKDLRRPPGSVVLVGDSGGQANLFADVAEREGVKLPALSSSTCAALRQRFPSLGDCANPLDLWALDEAETIYADGLPILLEGEPHLIVLGLDKFLARTEEERAFVRAGVKAVTDPGAVILMAFGGGDDADPEILRECWERRIPVVRGAGVTIASLASLERWERWRGEEASGREPPLEDPDAVRALAAATAPWTEHAAKRLVASAGVPVTREQEVATVEEAVAAAEETGFPVVLKIAGPGIVHKTEAGGVRLGVEGPDAVEVAARELLALGPRLLVAEQRRADLELVVGAFVDEQFGPCGVVGLGGTWTEVFGEAAVVAGPGSSTTARRALEDRPWGGLLLRGARGRSFPVERIIDAVLRLVEVVMAYGDRIDTVEVNPLFVEGDDVVAVDALVVPRKEVG